MYIRIKVLHGTDFKNRGAYVAFVDLLASQIFGKSNWLKIITSIWQKAVAAYQYLITIKLE